jgi:hypothetical protein
MTNDEQSEKKSCLNAESLPQKRRKKNEIGRIEIMA